MPSRPRSVAFDRTSVVLLGAHVAIWAAVILWMPAASVYGDIGRFVTIANLPGLPYRDFAAEFPPLQTLLIELLFRTDVLGAAIRVGLISIAADLAIVVVLHRTWGATVARRYLWLSLPLQVFMPLRLDYVSALLMVVAASVARREPDRVRGGVLLGVATLFRLWPAALAPLLLRARKPIVGFAVTVVTGGLAWFAIAGVEGPMQVATFRGSSGWHVESSVGSAWWLITDDPVRVEGGALRVGTTSLIVQAVLALVLVGVVIWTVRRTAAMRIDASGLPAVVVVASIIALSPLASPQYLAWLVPWCAIAAPPRSSRAMDALVGAAGVLAAASFTVYWEIAGTVADLRVPSFLRAACVAATAIVAARQLVRGRPDDLRGRRRRVPADLLRGA